MKVRIGIGLGVAPPSAPGLEELVGAMSAAGFDSIWLSEVLTAQSFDPLAALAWIAGRLPGTKVGTTILLPGRNLLRLAKQLATVDRLSGGRLLVTFVPGLAEGPEREAIGVPVAQRGDVIEEALPLLRRLLTGERVSHEGPTLHLVDAAVSPLPIQQPLDLWLGGMARRSLERCGRLADGWLPSRCTPAEAAEGRTVVEQAAAAAGRSIDPEHFGASVAYARKPLEALDGRLGGRAGRRATGELVPVGLGALRQRLEGFVEAGFSKFVVRPVEAPTSWTTELSELAEAVGDLQS